MCRNAHHDPNEFHTPTHRHSFSSLSPPSSQSPVHKRAQSSSSTNPGLSCDHGKASSPDKDGDGAAVDLAEVCKALNLISVRLEQSSQSDDRNSPPDRLKQLVHQTQQISTRLATMQRSHPEQLTGRSSVESRFGLGRLDDELERQLNQLYGEMAEVMGEVEDLSKATMAMSKQ